MTTTLNLKKVLHRPQWEMANPIPTINAAGSFAKVASKDVYNLNQGYLCVNTTNLVYYWDPVADSEILLPASGIAGTFGAGSCGAFHPMGPTFTASAGSTTTATSTLTINRDLRGCRIRVTSGPGAGDERIIASNTLGANSVITVTSAFSATITSSSNFQLITGRLWVFNPAATPGLGFWDWALSAWTAGKSVTGVTFTGTDGILKATPGISGNTVDSSDSNGNAALSGSSTNTVGTLAAATTGNSARNWTPGQWVGAVVQILAGTNAGATRIITANTANSFTVGSAFSSALDATSVWQITKAFASSGSLSTFASTTSTILTVTGSAWATNQWVNSQIRVIAGTGAGQIRTITANTGTTITTAAWSTNLDATSIWVIEGNDDNLYLAGNNAVALFKYSISGNTWATATATAARAGAPGAGLSLNWITGVNDSAWTSENAIQNGRYLYSFRGAAGAVLDKYDLAGTTWTSGIAYGNSNETFTTGCGYEYDGGRYIYIAQQATGRFFYFDILLNSLYSAAEHNFTQGAAIVGDKLFIVNYVDGSTKIPILYHWLNTSQTMVRAMLWNLY